MSKSKRKAAQQWKTGPKLIKVHHDESAAYTEFYIFTLGPDGKQAEPIGHGLFDAISQNDVTAMLTRLAQSISDCEIRWVTFGNEAMQDSMAWEHRDA
jgi:hypothetical protein